MNLIEKLKQAEASRKKYEAFSLQSLDWWRKKLQATVGGDRARTDLMAYGRQQKNIRNEPTIGRMYSFWYDAKHKDTLPYWDQFPLIFMIGPKGSDGFLGINLHFLPPRARAILFNKLADLVNNDKMDKRTKLRLSYQVLSAASKFALFQPCLKHYLFSHLDSKLILIPSSDWEKVLFLPTQSFVGASNNTVWSDSLLKV